MKGKKNSPMEPMLRRGTHIYIPFADGCALLNTRGDVRMYKNPDAFARHNPELAKTAELVEYAPVTGGQVMDDIKLAMLGDKEAAKRLTDAGVLLACPMCGKASVLHSIDNCMTVYAACPACGLMTRAYKGHEKARLAWNARAPILSAEEMEMLEGMG